jgi:hypothetical protein
METGSYKLNRVDVPFLETLFIFRDLSYYFDKNNSFKDKVEGFGDVFLQTEAVLWTNVLVKIPPALWGFLWEQCWNTELGEAVRASVLKCLETA